MIKNERQYRITKAEAEKFRDSLKGWDPTPPDGIDPVIHAAQKSALESQLQDLRREVAEYEALRSGRQPVLEVNSFEEFPDALVRARIAAGLSQKDLAERLGLKEQQVQKYEATGYSAASLTRMTEVVNALGLRVRKEVFLPATPETSDALFRGLAEIGFDRKFIERRLLPDLIPGETGSRTVGNEGFVFQAATRAGRILGVSPAALLNAEPLTGNRLLAATRFKVPAGANEQRLTAYTFYAHYLAMLMLQATAHLPVKLIPTDPEKVRSAILARYGEINFASALRFIWDHGVPVLPLDDPGAFHGACWRADGRNVIALKRRTPLFARWLQLALHEFRHAGEEPDSPEFAVVEDSETPDVRRDSREEKRANRFAAEVVLDGRAEELVQRCVDETRPRGRSRESGQIEMLQGVVPKVAQEAGVPADSLAEYLAYRLTQQGLNWWGAATNLQGRTGNPWRVARDIALEWIDFSRLNPIDRQLLSFALTDRED
jgi:transcriptional regulator with XRE-family HTH domain